LTFLLDLLDKLQQFILSNIWFAPLAAVFLPFLEAVIPYLPLTMLVAFNLTIMASAYGTVQGTVLTILLSTLGSFLGMFLIFGIIRSTFGPYFVKKVEDHKYGKKFLNMVSGPNVWLVLIILSNPFLPSSILNYAISLTKIKVSKYIFLTITSRLIIVMFLVFLGSVFDIQNHPINALWFILIYLVLFGIWMLWTKLKKNKESI